MTRSSRWILTHEVGLETHLLGSVRGTDNEVALLTSVAKARDNISQDKNNGVDVTPIIRTTMVEVRTITVMVVRTITVSGKRAKHPTQPTIGTAPRIRP